MAPTQMLDSRELGFPDGVVFRELFVSAAACCVVVAVSNAGVSSPAQRLFVRAFDSTRYTEISWPERCNSFQIPVISPFAPVLFVLGDFWRDDGGSTVGLYRVALPAGAPELVRHARFDGGWISQLVGLGVDANTLCVVRALETPDGGSTSISYSVCALDLSSGEMRQLTELPAVFA